METRHIKIEYWDGLTAKKYLLSSEINILHVLKRIKNYKTLRKKELISKNRLKTQFTSLKSKLNLIESTFPKEEIKTEKKKKRKSFLVNEDITSKNIKNELEEIKNKLAKLGG